MKLSFARAAMCLLLTIAVIVGCESMYNNGGRPAGGGAAGTADSPSDAFASAEGFFPTDSHDVVDGTPASIAEETEAEVKGEETASHFRGIQIDPVSETTAGPKFAMAFDADNDGLLDILSGWTQSQPVQLHLQRRDAQGEISFVSVNLGGTGPIAILGDLDMADFDGDGWLDVAVLVKETGSVGVCPKDGTFEALDATGMGEVQILFNPGDADQITDGDAWREVRLERSKRPIRRDANLVNAKTFPEYNGYTGMAVGEIDGVNGPDIVVALNPAKCEHYGDDPNPVNRIVLYANPGADNMFATGDIPLSVTALASGPGNVGTNGSTVTLDGSQSFWRQGIPDLGPAYGEVNYTWTQLAGPAVTLNDPSSEAPTFSAPPVNTTLNFRLDVSAGTATDFAHVTVVVGAPGNAPPTVEAGGEQTVVPNRSGGGAVTINLAASASDPDGDALTYAWVQVAGDPVTLAGPNTATPSFTAPSAGTELHFRVSVSDGTTTASDLVIVNSGFWAPVRLEEDLPRAGDVEMSDVDLDGDLDVVYTYPDALTRDIAWARNPVDVVGARGTLLPANWETRPVGHVDTEADVIEIGDVDADGYDDVLVRSAPGMVVQWFRHPGAADLEPIFPPPDAVPDRFNFPWQVYTIAAYRTDQGRAAGIGIGDLTGDGRNEITATVGGIVYWYDSTMVESPYVMWGENFVVDDTKESGTTDDPNDPDFQDDGTVLFNSTVADIDGDGFGDVIATFDRRVDSGLTDDTLIWFRNTLGDESAEE